MSAEYHRPLTVQELRDFVLDPRLNLPTSVAHLTSILEYYKSISVTLAGPNHAAPSVYPSDNAEGTSVKISLGSKGVFEGPDLEVKCGDVCTAEDGCTGHIGDLVLQPGIADGTVIVYSLVGAFACKAYARQCASCKTWYKFTGHGTGMLRLTKQTAFSLDLFLEHTERTRSSLGSQTFTQFGNSVSRAYAWSGLVPDAFERVPGTIHKFGQTSAFIDFWLTVCSASQFHYPTAVPCPAHGQGGCEEFVADGTALGPPQRLLSGARSLHAPAEPVLRGDVVIKNFPSRRFDRSILPNQWAHDDKRAATPMGKADALLRNRFRTACRVVGRHTNVCGTSFGNIVKGGMVPFEGKCKCPPAVMKSLHAHVLCLEQELNSATLYLLNARASDTTAGVISEVMPIPTKFVCQEEMVAVLTAVLPILHGADTDIGAAQPFHATVSGQQLQQLGLLLETLGSESSATSWIRPGYLDEVLPLLDVLRASPHDQQAVLEIDLFLLSTGFPEGSMALRAFWETDKRVPDAVISAIALVARRAREVDITCSKKDQDIADAEQATRVARAAAAGRADEAAGQAAEAAHAATPRRNPATSGAFYYFTPGGHQIPGRATHYRQDNNVSSDTTQYDDAPTDGKSTPSRNVTDV